MILVTKTSDQARQRVIHTLSICTSNLSPEYLVFPPLLPCCSQDYLGWQLLNQPFIFCVCVFFPFILDIKFVGPTSRGHTGERSHRISHLPSFGGACLNFSREKDSVIPFPRRRWSRILCTKGGSYGNKILYKILIFPTRFSCRRRFRHALYGEKILGKCFVWAWFRQTCTWYMFFYAGEIQNSKCRRLKWQRIFS